VKNIWAIVFGAVLLACFLLFAVAPFIPGWWLPDNVCSFGPSVDHLFYLILGFTGFFFVLTLVILVYAMWRFRGEPGRRGSFTHGSHKLELLWTAVPALILLFIAFAQVSAWQDIKYRSRMPAPDQVFETQARMWEWRMRYPSAAELQGMTETWQKAGEGTVPAAAADWFRTPHADDIHLVNEVHTWKGAKVRMMLTSRDVLHSFFLPNMRIKQDAVPGKNIPVWFDALEANVRFNPQTSQLEELKPNEPGKQWELACAELCGARHSMMRGKVYVHESKEDYLKWLEHAAQEGTRTTLEPAAKSG